MLDVLFLNILLLGVHCPCIICCYGPVHRSTEFRHWKKSLNYAIDHPAEAEVIDDEEAEDSIVNDNDTTIQQGDSSKTDNDFSLSDTDDVMSHIEDADDNLSHNDEETLK